LITFRIEPILSLKSYRWA